MTWCVVIDVGNTRIKWGLCHDGKVEQVAALPADPWDWQRQYEAWGLGPADTLVVSGVHPRRRDELIAWLRDRGSQVRCLESYRDLPIKVAVEEPDKVGIDRLLNAVAVNNYRPASAAAIIVDAGSAVTVDYVNRDGLFCGGAIFPGVRLMAKSLHDYTALLPLVEVNIRPSVPGKETRQAIEAGVFFAVVGGIERLIYELRQREDGPSEVYVTGGDGRLLLGQLHAAFSPWGAMTLQGIADSVCP